MRILVIEDEASLAKQLTSSIAEAGYAVDYAADLDASSRARRLSGGAH